jgi:glutathione S-transferase
MLELYHWEPNGPYLKPLILLHEKGLAYRAHYIDVLSLERSREALPTPSHETRLNLEGEGPLLVHDGQQISESFFMLEYLEDAFGEQSLRPADALGQVRVLAWARHINEYFMPAVNTLGCQKYPAPALANRAAEVEPLLDAMALPHVQEGWRRALTNDYSQELIDDSRRKVAISAHRLEAALADNEWLVGTAYSIADIDAFAIANPLPDSCRTSSMRCRRRGSRTGCDESVSDPPSRPHSQRAGPAIRSRPLHPAQSIRVGDRCHPCIET